MEKMGRVQMNIGWLVIVQLVLVLVLLILVLLQLLRLSPPFLPMS
jgi:hypothetical protein